MHRFVKMAARRAPATSVVALALVASLSATPSFAADPANGQTVMKAKCAVCHSWEKGQPNKMGPNLFGVYGTKAAEIEGYQFSPAMKKSGITWDDANLHTYLKAPLKMVVGGKMAFVGLPNDSDIDDVIAYLKSLK